MKRKGRYNGRKLSRAIVVVGTTPDYVARIHETYPGSVVFILDERFEHNPSLGDIPHSSLLFTSLKDVEATLHKTELFLSSQSISPAGIACFDCESLMIASRLASRLRQRFPSEEAIARTRNKFEARRIWGSSGVASPEAVLVKGLEETMDFFSAHGEDVVLKPISGSGSELLFHCRTGYELKEAVRVLERELPRRRSNPLFRTFPGLCEGAEIDPCSFWIAEEFIPGPEFSCDFVFHHGNVTLIRETGKVKAPDKPFGSVLAYTFPPRYPEGFSKEPLLKVLGNAVSSLGFDWGYFMADYILRDGSPVIIEITPRPGGDSIPDLLKTAADRDILAMYLDFVSGNMGASGEAVLQPESFASINLYAPREGIISHLDGARLSSLPEVKAMFFRKTKGDRIILPPRDYDNRLLGSCILAMEPGSDLVAEWRRLGNLLEVTISSG